LYYDTGTFELDTLKAELKQLVGLWKDLKEEYKKLENFFQKKNLENLTKSLHFQRFIE
jgi:hypothetical protein